MGMSANTPYQVVIIDLGAGNLRSVAKAVEKAASTLADVPQITVSNDPKDIEAAERIILPGVGAFASCMEGLNKPPGLRDALESAARDAMKPVFGICVGMQMFADISIEFGETKGLGWIPGSVQKLEPAQRNVRVPHMGWNAIKGQRLNDLFDNRNEYDGEFFYFLHSYHFVAEINHNIAATCDYNGHIIAAIAKDNLLGVQFHPEKSQQAGIDLIANFLSWSPQCPR